MAPKRTDSAPRTIVIEGRSIPVAYEEIPLDEVRLDPDNPRTRQQIGHANGSLSQADLQKLILEISGVSDLQRTIRENKGLLDPIYVRPDGRVAEGNCRTAIYLKLRTAQPKQSCWQRIPALRLPSDITERQIAVLQGNWHVAGKITWRAHEQAGHVHHMHSVVGMRPEEISAAIGMTEGRVRQLLDTYETMRSDVIPLIKKGDGRAKFSYVLEFYKNKKLADFRKSKQNVKFFTDLVVNERLKRGSEVRDLHKLLDNDRAREVLKNEGFDKAIALVGRSDPTADSSLFRKITGTTKALQDIRKPVLDRIAKGSKEKQILHDLFVALKNVADHAGVKLK